MKTGQIEINESSLDLMAESYLNRYKGYVDVYESKCAKAKAGVSISSADIVAFGKTLDMWENYHAFCESNGTLGELGPMPQVALDVVAAVQTKNILPLISSTQPIDEMQGIVYAKKIVAVQGFDGNSAGMGGVSPGDVLNSTLDGDRVHDGAFGAGRRQYSDASPLTTFATTDTESTIALGFHVLPETVKLRATDGATVYIWQDDGQGELLGNKGNFGTINYDTGAIVLTIPATPASDMTVSGTLDVNVEAEPNMVTVGTGYDSVPIHAEFFGLKTESGLLSDYSFSKRWGRSSSDEQAQDLSNELTNTINAAGAQRLIAGFSGGAGNTASYDRTPPSAISVAEHKLSFVDTSAKAEANLSTRAGRGVINRYIAGQKGAATLKGMPGFEAAAGGSMQQVGLYGTLDGIPVIRVTDAIANVNQGAATTDDVYGIYMGAGAFDAPLVNAPYLPLFVTSTMNFTNNPMRQHRAVGTMIGLKTVVDRYITRIELLKSA